MWFLVYLVAGMVTVGLYVVGVMLEDSEPDAGCAWFSFIAWPFVLPLTLGYWAASAIKARRKAEPNT